VLFTSPTSTITTSGDLTYDSTTSTLAAVNVSTLGTLTVGNASTDALIINAGTLTYNSNLVGTRAAGTLPAGLTQVLQNNVTATGDAGGTSNIRGNSLNLTTQGGSAISQGVAVRGSMSHEGSATLGTASGFVYTVDVNGSGAITTAIAVQGSHVLNTAANITTAFCVNANAPSFTSTGA